MTPSARALRRGGVVLAVAVAYGGGVLTGVVGSPAPAPAAQPAEAGSESPAGSVLEEAADRIADRSARAVQRDDLERAAVEGMLGQLGDRWSAYYGPAEFDAFRDAVEGRYSGVGVWLSTAAPAAPESSLAPAGSAVGGRVVVSSVAPGSPADEAGVRPGEELLAVDGTPVTGVDTAASTLRGAAEGTPVALTLRGEGPGQVRVVEVRRELVETPDVVVSPLPGGVAHVKVSAFTRDAGVELRDALARTPHGGGVVLDLRGNGGGLVTEAVEVASAFLRGGPVVHLERRDAARQTFTALGEGDTTTPLVVLVDAETASAAEIVAAALQDRRRAVVVGTRTYGKGSVQEPQRLSDGSALELTVGAYLSPDGRAIDGRGVEPDIAVAPGTAPEAALQRAADVLLGLVAAQPRPAAG